MSDGDDIKSSSSSKASSPNAQSSSSSKTSPSNTLLLPGNPVLRAGSDGRYKARHVRDRSVSTDRSRTKSTSGTHEIGVKPTISFSESIASVGSKRPGTASGPISPGTAVNRKGSTPNVVEPAEDYFGSNHHSQYSNQESLGAPRALSAVKRYESHSPSENTANAVRSAKSSISSTRTPSASHQNRRLSTPSSRQSFSKGHSNQNSLVGTVEENSSSRETHIQYLVQEKAYIQKIKNEIGDDYYVRGIASSNELENYSEDEESVSEAPIPGMGLGGVGTSFDDEYADIGSSYPFLEASYSFEDFGNPEHLKERLEWQAMLSSVLTGEVVRSEKRRIRPVKVKKLRPQQLPDEDLWLGIRSHVCHRTVDQQERALKYSRGQVNDILEQIVNFKVHYKNDEASLESAMEQVSTVLNQLEKAEFLYRSKQVMRQESELYGSPEFQFQLDAIISWYTISDAITQELDLLRSWTGNNDLDPTRRPIEDAPVEENSIDNQSLVEQLMRQDDVYNIFEVRIEKTLGPIIEKARKATLEYSDIFVKLGLPLFHERLQQLMAFPTTLIQEILRLRLVYAGRVNSPTMIILDQTLADIRLFLDIAHKTFHYNLEYTAPIFDKGWVFPNLFDENYNNAILDGVSYYLDLLQRKMLEAIKPSKYHQNNKEAEMLDFYLAFTQEVTEYTNGADPIIAEKFSIMLSKMLTKLLSYWEGQMHGPDQWVANKVEEWFNVAVETVRNLQRRLLRFYKSLRMKFHNAMEFSINLSKVKSFANTLRMSNHFLVITKAFEKFGIYAIADPSLYGQPERIKNILSGYCRATDRTHEENHVSYVLIFCIQEPLVWEGEIVNLDMQYSDIDIKIGRLRLASEGTNNELRMARTQLASLTGGGDIFDVAVEEKSHLTKVNHELLRLRRLFFRLSVSVITSAQHMRLRYSKHKPDKRCLDIVYNLFAFSREFGQRGIINVMDPGRRGSLAMKLIDLCIEWVSFICDDCIPSDPKTFRWSVVALDFAMVMTRGVNIMAISNEQFATLRDKVAGCMALLISHFDIMGARSQAEERKQSLEYYLRNKNLLTKDDAELFELYRDEIFTVIDQLEKRRGEMDYGGKIVDDNALDEEFLNFMADSLSKKVPIRWQQGRFIGGGSFGSVYAAVNLDTGGVMAVKEIRLQDTQSVRHLLKSIKEEMSVLEILTHPNIVQYYGVEVHRDRVFIFMEYCQGGSLAGLLEYGRIEDEQIIQVYTLQMLEGLAYLHDLGICHRDVKPENILLDHMGVVKFVDFGAAKVISKNGKTRLGQSRMMSSATKTKLNSMTGTPMYMSPEVITGSDPGKFGSTDVWSTGCCVLEMATGRRPWANLDNEWAIMYHIAAGHMPQLPSKDQLSAAGERFLMKCLERDPKIRPTAVELLNDPWVAYIRNIVLGQEFLNEQLIRDGLVTPSEPMLKGTTMTSPATIANSSASPSVNGTPKRSSPQHTLTT